MLYSKFIYHAKELTISQMDNEMWYLEPEWKDIICREIESDLTKIEDNYLTDWWDIENVLELEVQRRNMKNDKKNYVIDWLYDVVSTVVEPAMIDEENNLVKNVLEYMKYSHEQKDNIVPFPTPEE